MIRMGPAATRSGLILLLGGRSEIGVEVARRLVADRRRPVLLAARRAHDLDEQEQTILSAGASEVHRTEFDADDLASHEAFLDKVVTDHGPIGTAVVAFGVLGHQAQAERDADHAVAIVHTNLVAQISLLTRLANVLRRQGNGQIVVFSSIAGVRVRRANYVYGAAKAGLDGFACGLGDALHGSGVQLLVVRPGFVVGRMTEGMAPAPLSSTPAQVADAVVLALRTGRQEVWVPPALRVLAAMMRLTPRWLWRRMRR
jgi:short-subunit dehydrogenase